MTATTSTTELRAALRRWALDLSFASTPAGDELAALLARIAPAAAQGADPVVVLDALSDPELEAALSDGALAAAISRLVSESTQAERWWERTHATDGFLVAYFSMEFGVHERLPLYSGGLGVLAGDHLKAAADLGVPLVAVGLFYRCGYFRQTIDAEGEQAEEYPPNDPARLPLVLERDASGKPVRIEVELEDERVALRVWRAQVGHIRLLLLDADVEGNSEAAREITDALYGGDREHRLRQEVVLGVGGPRALATLGHEPSVFHVNEGHAAFLALERLRVLVEERGQALEAALEEIRASTVFTTHTPVPAGNELFQRDLVARYLAPLAARAGLSEKELLELGATEHDESEFGMTELALRTSQQANAVSALHGEVARDMWASLWPERAVDDVPIGHVTNGVHAPSWISPELTLLLRAAGVRQEAAPDEAGWERALELDERELWELHRRRKEALAAFGPVDPDALTIGFARRFASYKRAWLLFSDPDRLRVLLDSAVRPVQMLVSGKAHPADGEGKEILADLVRSSRDPAFAGRVLFVPNYDIAVAKVLVQGVDLWLTTPRRPNEASGTSGMKAALNGALNLSVLDGWWPEAYAPETGWAIPEGISAEGDEAEATELLRLLEEEVVPAFYERDADGLPTRWLQMAKASIARVGHDFGAQRMLVDYVTQLYLPAHEHGLARD